MNLNNNPTKTTQETMQIISMGCGGGRHQTLDQTFKTGGFLINAEKNIHVDPGPGALLLTKQLGLDPLDLDAVFVSHSHTDHQSDAQVMVEATNREPQGKGRFIGSESAINGTDQLTPAISKNHKQKIGESIPLKPGEKYKLNNIEFQATRTKHGDPTGIGVKIKTNQGTIGYTSDTEYFEELPQEFKNSRILIANVTRPGNKRIDGHLCSDDLIKMLEIVEPELAMISHMGMLFLRDTPTDQAKYVEQETGVKTIPALLGTKLEISSGGIEIGKITRHTDLDRYS